MLPAPELTDEARKVLDIIVRNNSIDGSSLMRQMGLSHAADLVDPIRELQKLKLIEVGGPVTPEELPFARFAVRPSAKEYLNTMYK
jgi:hypothetical protein